MSSSIPESGRTISVLGSTGSVGRQTLEVADFNKLRIAALSAGSNIKLLEEQVRRFKPKIAAVNDEAAARDFKTRVTDLDIQVCSGKDGLLEAACVHGAQTVVTAVVGMAGLLPTLAAIKLGRRIALANKETLVCAGDFVMKYAADHNATIIPVDSEHSAIFQCLEMGDRDAVKKIFLTASGGPFRGMTAEKLANVTPEMALRHPTWNMGKKISIDSSTMMNKGLEVIEAVHLFAVPVTMVKVLVHPESIIHSLVEFSDNSVAAQLAQPDMRLPIQYALTYPNRIESLTPEIDFAKLSKLTFEEPDMAAFPCLSLAIKTAEARGTAGAVLNGANEAAVDLFLQGKLRYYGIYESVRAALESIGNIEEPSISDIIEAGEKGRHYVYESLGIRC